AFERGGNQDVARHAPEIVGRDGLGTREAAYAAMLLHVGEHGGHIQTTRVVDAAGVVLHRHDLGTRFGEQAAGRAAHVAETLHGHAGAFDRQAGEPGRLDTDREHAAPGGLDAAERAAQVHRFAGDDAGGGGAHVHRVGVHHPGHDLAAGVDVGGRDVLGRADQDADLAGVAAREAFQFTAREGARVDAHTALGAAVGDIDGGVLDAHPGRQGHDLGQGHVLVEAHAALAGAAAGVVLHAVALEVGDGAVVQFNGHVHHQDALGAL